MGFHLSRLTPVLVLLFVGLNVDASPVLARPPSRVELSGDFEIVRESDDPCQISVPSKITGTLTLTIDFMEGTANGSLQGSGSGSDEIPPSCTAPASTGATPTTSVASGNDVYRAETSFSGVISRDAYDVLTDTTLTGRIDGTTGEFVVYAIIEVEGSGSHGVPGSTYSCAGSTGLQSECPIGEIVSPQPATITGRVVTGEAPVLEIDWYTNFCARAGSDGIMWGRTGCPTKGTSQPGVVSFVPAPNSNPVIKSLTLDDPEPYTGDTVVVTVDATDPDGDPLTYSWVMTDLVDSDGATATWRPGTAQTYTIAVSVEDGLGGTAEESTEVTVIDPAPVTTAEPVEEPDAAPSQPEDAGEIEARPDEPSGVDDPDDVERSSTETIPAEDEEILRQTGGRDSGSLFRGRLGGFLLVLGLLLGVAAVVEFVRQLLRGLRKEAAWQPDAVLPRGVYLDFFHAGQLLDDESHLVEFEPEGMSAFTSSKYVEPDLRTAQECTVRRVGPVETGPGGAGAWQRVQFKDGTQAWVAETSLRPFDKLTSTYRPSHQLVGSQLADGGYGNVETRSDGRTSLYHSGTKVQVVRTEGSKTLVRTGPKHQAWVDSERVQPLPKQRST